jgi:cell division protein FtsB
MNTYHQVVQFADELSKMHEELQQLRTSNAALRAERHELQHHLNRLSLATDDQQVLAIVNDALQVLQC